MGQRNEKSLEDKMQEARAAITRYEAQIQSLHEPDEVEAALQKKQRAENFVEFARWMLGQKRELEL
jgi:hypothetical protein